MLRAEVVEHAGFPTGERVLFHTDEAMSGETVRHLDRIAPLLLLIRNLAVRGEALEVVTEAIAAVAEVLREVEQALKPGKVL